jgi:hypothetical protein
MGARAVLSLWCALLGCQVLLFNAYFQEAVHESRSEEFRVRKVDILLYLVVRSPHIFTAPPRKCRVCACDRRRGELATPRVVTPSRATILLSC